MSPVDIQHMEHIRGPTIPEPYRFAWLRQQLAAFLLLRGPHAYFGTGARSLLTSSLSLSLSLRLPVYRFPGWGMAKYHEWQPEYDLDFGIPLQVRSSRPLFVSLSPSGLF
jgi:hypothetical protein